MATAPRKRARPVEGFIEFALSEVEGNVVSRFERMAGQYSHKTAIVAQDKTCNYSSLNQTVNRLAHAILERSGEGQEAVALLLGHGAAAVTGILAILKAGKFYVPADPAYPHARLTYMLADSGACLILTDSTHRALAKQIAGDGVAILDVDEVGEGDTATNPDLEISPDDLAYLIYTSGSTGNPKGVMQNHRNLLHLVWRGVDRYRHHHADRLVQLASTSWGGSVQEIFGALLNGATLYPYDVKAQGVAHFPDWLEQNEITWFQATATLFRHIAMHVTREHHLPHLRLVNVGGEPVRAADVLLFQSRFPVHTELRIGMGITEAHNVADSFYDHDTELGAAGTVPIGFTGAGKAFLLWDEHGREVAAGEVGEIVVRSRYLSPGYWRQPEKTRQVFLPDPEDGAMRLYRSGDLGRWLSDGRLQHVGRADTMLKVRGYRIDAGEIETALLSHPQVKEAVVVGRPDETETSLFAYLVTESPETPSPSALRDYLSARLPDFMLPARFIYLDSLPLTSSNKIDRNALPAPSGERPPIDTPFRAPVEPLEQVLAAIWSQILGVSPVGLDDSFLELGGDSLRAARLVARLQRVLGVELPERELLEAPTVAAMAAGISALSLDEAEIPDLVRLLDELEAISEQEARRMLEDAAS